MADDQTRETVSREAHDRMTAERDALKTQLAEATAALSDMTLLDKTRTALKGQVADVDLAAEMLLPHLRGTDVTQIGETLAGDRFVSMMSLLAKPADTPSEAPVQEPPTNPGPQSSFAGPNPGATGGPPPEPPKLSPADARRMTPDQLAKANEDGQIAWRDPNPAGGYTISERLGGGRPA